MFWPVVSRARWAADSAPAPRPRLEKPDITPTSSPTTDTFLHGPYRPRRRSPESSDHPVDVGRVAGTLAAHALGEGQLASGRGELGRDTVRDLAGAQEQLAGPVGELAGHRTQPGRRHVGDQLRIRVGVELALLLVQTRFERVERLVPRTPGHGSATWVLAASCHASRSGSTTPRQAVTTSTFLVTLASSSCSSSHA